MEKTGCVLYEKIVYEKKKKMLFAQKKWDVTRAMHIFQAILEWPPKNYRRAWNP